jgi:23S rRNA (uracil1939-C5)-methyltransferase
MVAGDSCELTIQRLVAGGDGIGFLDGLAVFVPLAAPGDVLSVRISEVHRDYAKAEILELIEASTQRIAPACPLYGKCGGCNIMHLTYESQAAARHAIFTEAFRRAGVDADALPPDIVISASPPFGYRNRAQFHTLPGGSVGYARRASNAVIPVQYCPILVQSLRVWVEGRDTEVQVEVGGKPFLFNIQGFFQSNLAMLGHLVAAVCEGMSGSRAADLYAGIGLFGAFLKDNFDRVVCVEQDMQAVGYACRNVGRDADFAAADMVAWTASAQARAAYDYVVVDPPRSGLAPAVRTWLGTSKPPVVSYVSCNPVSLARDAVALLASGYHMDRVQLFDFYPQTGHVESCVRFCLA